MLSLGSLAFASPWLLAGLVILPALWWLLRVTPPAPRSVPFPALRLLLGLVPREETPARTPLWLILLRMVLIALIVSALAHPLLNPRGGLVGNGPLVIAIDNGWSSARHWDERRALFDAELSAAERDSRRIVLLPTASPPGVAAAPALSIQRANDARAAADELAPVPWPEDRKAALDRLAKLGLDRASRLIWLSDGIEDGEAGRFVAGLQKYGPVKIYADAAATLPRLLTPAPDENKDLAVTVKRADAGAPDHLFLRAVGEDGRLYARSEVALTPGQKQVVAHFSLPTELRNRVTSIVIEGEPSAGSTLLLDERWRRRPVGIVGERSGTNAQPLLSGSYYIERALSPFAEVHVGAVGTLLKSDIAVLALPDSQVTNAEDTAALDKWIDSGGLLLRFAGPHLAARPDDDLLPVTLRGGGRSLGGTLSWSTPAPLAPFAANSPFAGLAVPKDVTVSRQVLAEPTTDLGTKTWARLADGTPLATAEKRGKGWLVLIHTSADPEWSNLAISGLFVEMLRRIVAMSEGVTGNSELALPPVANLDGFGRLTPAAASAEAIAAGTFASTLASPRHPPGFYGTEDARRALNLFGAVTRFEALGAFPQVERASYAIANEVDFRPWLLGAALLIALIDLLIGYALRGLLPRWGAAGLLLLLALPMPQAQADDDLTIRAANQFHLAYIRTGNLDVDEETRAGLVGLSGILTRRTAVDVAEPVALDPETDELIFFPVIYWPVVDGQTLPSALGVARINRYLATGGMILFDTRSEGDSTTLSANETQARLRRLAAGLAIPALAPIAPDHVLTKSFYLMQEFPGRWAGGSLWIEAGEDSANDGVATVIVGGNDWAGAWAVDANGEPLYPVVPGGETQREYAYRFGVNLVMYALTGNYKTDQVHVPAILERLGQ